MDQVQPQNLKKCSTLGLHIVIIILSLVTMSHSAIKEPHPMKPPDHEGTEYSSLDSHSEPEETPCMQNCEPHGKVRIESLLKTEENNNHDVIYRTNGTGDFNNDIADIKVSQAEDKHHWKVKVIIVCTIAASVEIVIVVFILIYWKDIRWTMRKMYCPCDEHRVRRRDHEAMEPSGPSPSDSGFQGDDLEQGQQVQTYQTRRRGEVEPLEEQPMQTTAV